MQIRGIGIDIAEVKRFRELSGKRKQHALNKLFSRNEQTYCFSHADAAPHLAGTFAAKEAVIKAGESILSPLSVEIRREGNGKPSVWIEGKRSRGFLISISHSRSIACAIALKIHV